MNSKHPRYIAVTAAVAALLSSSIAGADETEIMTDQHEMQKTDVGETARDAQEQVSEALKVVAQMKKDPQLTNLLARARGVYIVPDFGKAAVGVGGRGGEGVLLLKQNGQWTGPAFYNFGRISAGLQAGVSVGSVAMLLMTQDAVQPFKTQDNNFALDATAGLTVVNYSANARSTAGEPDVIAWSDTEGLFAGASIGVTDFNRDQEENRAYYNQPATPTQIFSEVVTNDHADALREALPTQTASR